MLKIIIIGTRNRKQKALITHIKQALEALMIQATIVEITNLDEIIANNIILMPALVIRNQVLSQGIVPQVEELKDLIAAFLPNEKNSPPTLTEV